MLKSNFKTIDSALRPKHLFQMTVSSTHSVNLAGLNASMTALGLIGKPAGTQPCTLYFAVPPDVYPIYQHKPGSMVPVGSILPGNVSLMVLEIPLPETPVVAAAASSSIAASPSTPPGAGSKRKQKPEDADSIVPPSKKSFDTKCDCTTGCKTSRCQCLKRGNKCGAKCHTAAAPAAAAGCANV